MPKRKAILLGIGGTLLCLLVIVGIPAVVLATLGHSTPEPTTQTQTPQKPDIPDFRMKTYLSAKPIVPKEDQEEVGFSPTSDAEPVEQEEEIPSEESYQGVPPVPQADLVTQEDPEVQEATPTPDVTPSTDAIFWLGDSVSVLSKNEILNAFPNAEVNAVSGRTLAEGLPEVQAKQKQGWAPKAVVIELGANTVADEDEFTGQYCAILDLIPTDVPIFAVTIKTAGTYHNMHNACIQTLADLRSNVYLVDWYSLAAAHEEWLSDGCHPTTAGAQEFVSLIQETINNTLAG